LKKEKHEKYPTFTIVNREIKEEKRNKQTLSYSKGQKKKFISVEQSERPQH